MDARSYPLQARLAQRMEINLRAQDNAIYRQMMRDERTERTEVARRTREEIRRLRSEGADVRSSDRPGIEAAVREKLLAERDSRLQRMAGRGAQLQQDKESWNARGRFQDAADAKRLNDQIGAAVLTIRDYAVAAISVGTAVVNELVQVKRRLATAGPKRS